MQGREDDIGIQQALARRHAEERSLVAPAAALVDLHPQHLVAAREQAVANARSRRQRDLALRRAPAGEHGDRQRRCSQALRHAQPPGAGGLGVVVLVVVGVVVVGVVVVGVLVVFEASTPTESFTSEPLRTRWPEGGLCLSTTPTWDSCSVCCSTALGVRPALPSVAAACVSESPTRLGTATRLVACASVRLTFAPERTDVPGRGDCESTVSAVSLDTWCVSLPTASPAFLSAASAALRDSPRTSGTRTGAGPLETFTSTTLPACSSVPAGGSVPITRPALIVELGCELLLGMKPATFSRARACVADSPSTEGSATMPGPVEITILTCPACLSVRPARGDWLETSPLGTVALEASEGTGVSPARLSVVMALCSERPVTRGTRTRAAGESSSASATPAPASSASRTPKITQRRRLLVPSSSPLGLPSCEASSRAPAPAGCAGAGRASNAPVACAAPEPEPDAPAATTAPVEAGSAARSCWSTAMNSSASVKRCAGSFASARSTTASRLAGTAGLSSLGGRG